MQRDPAKRLGTRNDAEEVKKHCFFRGVNWSSVLNKEVVPEKIVIKDINRVYISPEKLYGEINSDVANRVTGWTFVSNLE
jgi:hypothetical protein